MGSNGKEGAGKGKYRMGLLEGIQRDDRGDQGDDRSYEP